MIVVAEIIKTMLSNRAVVLNRSDEKIEGTRSNCVANVPGVRHENQLLVFDIRSTALSTPVKNHVARKGRMIERSDGMFNAQAESQ